MKITRSQHRRFKVVVVVCWALGWWFAYQSYHSNDSYWRGFHAVHSIVSFVASVILFVICSGGIPDGEVEIIPDPEDKPPQEKEL